MEKSQRYPGVYWNATDKPDGSGKERSYYILYRKKGEGREGKLHKEPIGTTSQGMTEARASQIRALRIVGKEATNKEQRQKARQEKLAKGLPQNLEDLWSRYLEEHSGNASIKQDQNRYQNHIPKKLGKKPLGDIQTTDIAALRKTCERKALKPQTVKHILGLVRRILRFGQKMGWYSMPPTLIFDMPQVDNVKTETMTQAQYVAYLKALDEEEDQDKAAFLRLALFLGPRKGNLLGLKWEDIDFERGFITWRGEEAKSGKTEILPTSDEALEVLAGIARTSDYVFPGRGGGKREDFRRMARRVREKAGLPKDFRPLHGLRHTFASQLANQGVALYTIKELLTHSNISMTERYAHLRETALRDALNRITPPGGRKTEPDK